MIEGVWAHYCGLGLPDGDFGLGKSCPGMHGEQEDCMVRFDRNFLHLRNSTAAQCAGGYSKKHYNKGHWVGGNSTVRAARVRAWTFALLITCGTCGSRAMFSSHQPRRCRRRPQRLLMRQAPVSIRRPDPSAILNAWRWQALRLSLIHI